MKGLMEELRWRGFIDQVSDPEIEKILDDGKLTCYIGFDPTATSLQIGNLLVIMALSHFLNYEHDIILLIGGATALIGDPSGKSKERNLQSEEVISTNTETFKKQFSRFLVSRSEGVDIRILNNAEWLVPYKFVHFLRDVGKYFRIGDMLAKESVRNRMDREEGISFTEFSYMLMQAYDFLHLFEKENCTLQVGGSDQWGNITAGIELIRRLKGKPAYGITFPLLTTSSGQKLGKTEEGTIWLDNARTSSYQFYQFWVRTEDSEVIKYLKLFTYLERNEIENLASQVEKNPEKREAQKKLAYIVTALVHGEASSKSAVKASEVLYGEEISGFYDDELEEIFSDVPSTNKDVLSLDAGIKLFELLTETGLCPSKGAAKKLISQGGVYVNNVRVSTVDMVLNRDNLASEGILVLRTGKKNYHLVRFK